MAKSKLIIGRRKKSTVLVSMRTLQEALSAANIVAESLMEANPNDPNLNKVEGAAAHISRILNANPQQMKIDGVQSISDYMDSAKMPAEAQKLKNEVDMILKLRSSTRQGQPASQEHAGQPVNYVPDSAVSEHGIAASTKQADCGAAGFVTDRDEKGEAKAPEKLEVPRLAGKKKKEAEDPAALAAPVPAAPAPAAAGNPIDYIPTETLIKVIGDLPKEDDFAQNKGKQDAVVQLTEILKSRPVLPPEQAEGAVAPVAPVSTAPALAEPAAVPAPVAASAKKADLGDHAMGQGETISNGSGASSSIGQGGATHSPKPVNTDSGINNPQKSNAIDLGGLSVASSLEEDKTADDYRMVDYKVTDEGVRPELGGGRLPSMDEQESGHNPRSMEFPAAGQEELPVAASMEKEAVTPPGISEELMHKLKSEYPGDKSKAYATAWSIHNKKESSLRIIAAEVEKIANAYGGGWYSGSGKPMVVEEDGGRVPEIAEAHAGLEDNTGISRPETKLPSSLAKQQGLKTGGKVAADLSTGKAVKQSETLGNDLKKLYLEAKSLTQVNDTRPVREAVEAIFRAADMFDEATKALNKQHQQEESEAAAAEIKAKNKKSSSFGGLAFAAAE